MECFKCTARFDLGIKKPMKFCCSTLCYSCLFELTLDSSSPNASQSRCLNCNSKILDINNYSVDYSLIKQLNQYQSRLHYLPKAKSTCSICLVQEEIVSLSRNSPNICNSCLSLKKSLKSSLLLCKKGHKFALKVESPNKTDCILCKNIMKAKVTCPECCIDICNYCTDLLVSLIKSAIFVKCLCEGEIVWMNNLKSKKCNFCKETFANIGSFFCAYCGKNRCFLCFFQVFMDLTCQTCKVFFSFKVLPRVSQSEELFCGYCENSDCLDEDFSLNSIFKATCRGCHIIDTYSNYPKPCSFCNQVHSALRCGRCQSSFCFTCYQWLCYSQPAPYSKCLQGHESRLVAISNEFHDLRKLPSYDDPYGTKRVTCRSCNKRMRDLSYMCLPCKLDQCEDCYNFLSRHEQISISCPCQNHSKITYSHTKPCIICESCKKSFEKSGSFICNICNTLRCLPCVLEIEKRTCARCCKFSENFEFLLKSAGCGHSFCEPCFESFGSVQNCLQHLENFVIRAKPVNQEGCLKHLFSEFQSPEAANCSNCLKEKKNLWTCLGCKVLMCLHCKIWTSESMFVSNKFSCLKGHQLKLIPCAQRLYNRSGKYFCDGCNQKVSGMSFHCFQCDLDYCPLCFFAVIELMEVFEKMSCLCNQKIKWVSAKNDLKCFTCSKKLKKTGYFMCLGCKKPYCIRCSGKFAEKLQKTQKKITC